MTKKKEISTKKAPSAIGAYSQAIKTKDFIFISGQIPLNPETMEVVEGTIDKQILQVLENIKSVADEAKEDINNCVKITVYLTDLNNFQSVNAAMESFFKKPYPARAAVEVSKLPKDVKIEMDAILYVGN
ncbi:MAG: reactive intermediate/imine deaminase [Gammaproteobacteria bacterium]|nr:reactive intermediate/imine deaminase [Gammaproteobacteria bacterium]